ncbi:MAG: type VI secretion system tip protein TssI/VgrG [Minicystis sp.]
MSSPELRFASGQDALSVRHFSVKEGLSALFEVSVVAVSPLDDLDFEAFVGHAAGFTIHTGGAGRSCGWTGVCNHFEQRAAEETGLSTYLVRIVPALWLATQRHDCRIFQHHAVPAIVRAVLAGHHLTAELRLDLDRYPEQEYRVQYAESDFAFISRLMEEAGISYRFSFHPEEGSKLVLSDTPHRRKPRPGGPIVYLDRLDPAAHAPCITQVSAGREIRPGAVAIRDFDFRRRNDHPLGAEAQGEAGVEARLEHYRYQPGAFVIEGKGHHAHADAKEGKALAERSLEAERSRAEIIGYRTNLVDLAPGTVFSIGGHPRARIAAPHELLAIDLTVEGSFGEPLTIAGRAVPAAAPYRPARVTHKPRIAGVQSAIVIGPEGEAIHTDEHGRVRVRFHWDRAGKHDDARSCWIRVSQGWAGSGFGMMVLPRVGQEVLVGFFEGDPDQPVVVGRVYNAQNPTPYALPEHKTRSGWRSESTPSSGEAAYNEIFFEDARGKELLSIHAQRDLHKVVKESEIERTGADRTITVGRDRSTTVGGSDSTTVGAHHAVHVAGSATGLTMRDRHIVFTTGEASVTFDGGHLSLEAQGNVTIVAHDGDVVIQGGPNVKINCD